MLCRCQVITGGMGGIIDINIPAVIGVMNVCGIENQEKCLKKVIKLFRLSQQNVKDKENESC